MKACLCQFKVLFGENSPISCKINRMINLYKYIKENYGWDALKELQQWEKGKVKQTNYNNHRILTLRCISNGLVPVMLVLVI